MSPRVLFYVSGHGFGHARRVTQVVRALASIAPHVEVFIRSAAPARVFEPIAPGRVEQTSIDAGMAEDGPLAIDAAGTLGRLITLLERRDPIIAEELAAVRRIGAGLIVADIPFLAGDVAAAGVPCVGMSNFTWDWICDPLLAGEEHYPAVRAAMVAGYAKMEAVLRLPLGDVSEGFREKVPVPLIAGRSTRGRGGVIRRLGIDERDGRPRVLVAMRGGVPPDVLAAAACGAPEFLLLGTQDLPAGLPPNVRAVRLGPELDFSDLVAVCDAVVSKLGYGIVSDCAAAGEGAAVAEAGRVPGGRGRRDRGAAVFEDARNRARRLLRRGLGAGAAGTAGAAFAAGAGLDGRGGGVCAMDHEKTTGVNRRA